MSYLVTDVKDEPVSVLFHLDLIDQLRKSIRGGRRNRVFRGVLLGHTATTDGQHTLVSVETFDPAGEPANGLAPIGIVRSWVRGHLYLDKADRATLGGPLGQLYSVLLVVRSPALGVPVAGAFLCKSGQVTSESSFAEFPLDRTRIASGGFAVLQDAAVHDAAMTKRAVSKGRPARVPAWAWIPAAVAMLALCALVLRHGHLRGDSVDAHSPADAARILLSLQRAGNDLLLKWDADNPKVRAADRAVLRIADGSIRRSVPLNAGQLQVGAAQYHPVSSDVEFQLEIPGASGVVSDPVRFISPEPRGAPVQEHMVAMQGSELPRETRTNGESDRTRLADVGRQRAHHATIQISYDPIAPSVLRRVVSKMRGVSLLRFRNEPGFVPPRVTHEVAPLVTASTARQLTGERRVQLRANIDPNGHVTDVQALSRGADPGLVELSEAAIRRWQFTPALLNNQPVASSVRFTVQYENPSSANVSARR